MKKTTYRILTAIITGGMGGTMGWSFAMGYKYPPFIALIIGVSLMYILARYKPKKLEADERTNKIAGKSALAAYQIYTLTAAVFGLSLKTFAQEEIMNTIGDFFLFSACGMIVLYLLFYSYYNKKGE